ncbi:MAG: DUF1818 family protein [Cyanobacteria bacterium M_DeepCast_200m_mx_001]|nr:DUF1818 family protein [Cyanobacteria bacterium M_DeepCast_200m_mx_001]
MIQKEGEGWRLAWDGDRQPFSVLVGGDGWAVELTAAEAEGLRQAVADLVAQHGALVDQLMAEEAIALELERGPWWLELEGDRSRWSLRMLYGPGPGQRGLEGHWGPAAAPAFSQALQQLYGQP